MLYCKGKIVDMIFCKGKQLWTFLHKGRSDWGPGSSYLITGSVHNTFVQNVEYEDFWNIVIRSGTTGFEISTVTTFLEFQLPPPDVVAPVYWENRTTDGTYVGGAEGSTVNYNSENVGVTSNSAWGVIYSSQSTNFTIGGKGHWTLYKEYGALS